MSIEAMSVVWKAQVLNERGKPDHTRKLVLLRFADHANKQGRCWPLIADIAAYSQLSVRQVRREVGALVAAGLLEIVEDGVRPGRGRVARAPVYKMQMDQLRGLPQVEVPDDGSDSLSVPSMARTEGADGSDKPVDGSDKAVSPQSSVTTTTNYQPPKTEMVPHHNGVMRTPDGKIFIPPEILAGWQRQFPLVNVPGWLGFIELYAQIRRSWAHQRRNWHLTILRWLQREQERAEARGLRRPEDDQTLEQRKEQMRRELEALKARR